MKPISDDAKLIIMNLWMLGMMVGMAVDSVGLKLSGIVLALYWLFSLIFRFPKVKTTK